MKRFLLIGLLFFPVFIPLQSCATTISVEDQISKAKTYLASLTELRKILKAFPGLEEKVGKERLDKLDKAIGVTLALLDKVAKGSVMIERKDWIGILNLALEVKILLAELED